MPADAACFNLHAMDFVVNSDGFLSQPNLHDGHVSGLALLDKSTLQISMQAAGGEAYTMVLGGLQRLRCDGFAEGNTVFSIEITRNAAPKLETLYRLTGEPPAREPYRSRHEEWMAELSRDIIQGHLTLMSLEPSYGCIITALCESIQIGEGA